MATKISDLTTSTLGSSDYVAIARTGSNFKLNLLDSLNSFAGSSNIVTVGTITSGTWSGTEISVSKGGTGATDASTARSNLGLGTISTQNSSSVSITGGTISGITAPLTVGSGTAGTLSGNPGVSLTGSISVTSHGFSDERTFSAGTSESYNSVDLIPQLNGRTSGSTSLHYAAFQFRAKQLSGTFTNMYGLVCSPEFTGGTTVSLRNIFVTSPAISGGATVTTVYGIQFGNLKPAGVTYGVAIASDYASTVSWHVGAVSFGYGSIPPTDTQVYIYPNTANLSAIKVANYSLTGSNTVPMFDLVGTWNTSGLATLIKANLTDTASNASSLLIDLQVGSVTKFNVTKSGVVNAKGLTVSGASFTEGYCYTTGAYVYNTSNLNLTDSYNGKVIISNNTTGIAYTINSGLSQGFSCQVLQNSTGLITFTGAAGVTLNSYGGLTQIAGRYGSAAVQYVSSESYILAGNLS